MPHTQQRLKSISIDGLRRIKRLNISFEGNNITGIFGANGSGKTTLLYTLLCIYKPQTSIQYNFGAFFKRCKEHEFDATVIRASVHYRYNRDEKDIEMEYKKSPGSDRWTPKTSSRPERDVFYFGINTCVPLIEEEIKITQKYNYVDGRQISDSVRIAASRVLGIQYATISHKIRGKKEHYYATIADGTEYYSVSMGAGEQRVLRILEFLERIPNYSLIIIDEIDLTLHTAALHRLMDYLVLSANSHHHQIVFTSHREELIERKDINIRHLFQTSTDTLCFNETRPDCIDRLTGTTVRPLEIYVEDDLTETIIAQCADDLGIRKRVDIKHFGSCSNAFVLSSAFHMIGYDLSNQLFVLDGDLYKSNEERLMQIKKHYLGDEPGKEEARNIVLESIKSLNLPNDYSPEKYINEIISIELPTSNNELRSAAIEIIDPADTHEYLDSIIEKIGDSRSIGLFKIIEEMKKHPEWENYIEQVKDWLYNKKNELDL